MINLSNEEKILTMVLKLMNILRSISPLMVCIASMLSHLSCVPVKTGVGWSPYWGLSSVILVILENQCPWFVQFRQMYLYTWT